MLINENGRAYISTVKTLDSFTSVGGAGVAGVVGVSKHNQEHGGWNWQLTSGTSPNIPQSKHSSTQPGSSVVEPVEGLLNKFFIR